MQCLVIIDMQNDFINGALAAENGESIIDYVCAQITTALNQHIPVYFTLDTHDSNYLNTTEGKNLPIEHCIKGTNGWQLSPKILDLLQDLELNKDYYLIEKTTFASTDLLNYVNNEAHITMMGICSDICVVSNALLLKAHYPDAHICVDTKGCAGVSEKSHQEAINTMKACQIHLI